MISKLFKSIKAVLKAAPVCAAILAAPAIAKAQTYGPITLSAVPSTLTTAVATNCTATIDCRYNRNIGIYIQAAGSNTTTSAITAVFNQSADGLNFDTLTPRVVTFALNNTTTAGTTTNYDIGAIGWMRLAYVTNAAAVGVSNLMVQVSFKPGQ